jgi:hypothetical protein
MTTNKTDSDTEIGLQFTEMVRSVAEEQHMPTNAELVRVLAAIRLWHSRDKEVEDLRQQLLMNTNECQISSSTKVQPKPSQPAPLAFDNETAEKVAEALADTKRGKGVWKRWRLEEADPDFPTCQHLKFLKTYTEEARKLLASCGFKECKHRCHYGNCKNEPTVCHADHIEYKDDQVAIARADERKQTIADMLNNNSNEALVAIRCQLGERAMALVRADERRKIFGDPSKEKILYFCRIYAKHGRAKFDEAFKADRTSTSAEVEDVVVSAGEADASPTSQTSAEVRDADTTSRPISAEIERAEQRGIEKGHREYYDALWSAKLKYPKFNLSGLTAEANLRLKEAAARRDKKEKGGKP